MITVKQAKLAALDIVESFPDAKTVQEAFDLAVEAKFFDNENDVLAIWDFLCQLLPQQVA